MEKASAEDKFKTVLLRSVSHELRTPLNAISLITQELLDDKNVSLTEDLEKLRMISVSSKLLITLVNDLLDFSRMLAGVFSIQKTNFNLKLVIENAFELIKIQAKKKNLYIYVRIDNLIPDNIYTDHLRLSQVLLNLLSNAIKFTLTGYIEIICSLTEKGRLKVRVKDTGIGINHERLDELFVEFNTTSIELINPNGCGLGLHISNKIVRELGGDSIHVSSHEGKGSEFVFCIDIFENEPDEIDISSEPEEVVSEELIVPYSLNLHSKKQHHKGYQVLIVDDNDLNRAILSSLLSRNNITSDEAYTGKDAVSKILEQNNKCKQYKLVIMDGEMPELDGWEATKTLLELEKNGHITNLPAIIGYTAYNGDEDLKRSYQCGMKECLLKPSSAELLLSTILKYL